MFPHLFTIAGLFLFAYLIGSIPFGLVSARLFKTADLRSAGSGNIGATNALRTGGLKPGLATLAGDLLKGAVPVMLAAALFSGDGPRVREVGMSICALAAFLGHLYPVYLKFKTGGKGVATAAGCFAVISPATLLATLAVFLGVTLLSRRVSAGSLSAALFLPAGVFGILHSLVFTGCALAVSALIIFRHRANISRLIAGTEPPIWGKH